VSGGGPGNRRGAGRRPQAGLDPGQTASRLEASLRRRQRPRLLRVRRTHATLRVRTAGSDSRRYARIAGALLLAEQAIHHGPINKIKDVVAEYAASGLDLLVLMPEVRSLRRLELLSEQVLPEYRH
jgi:hypothetical protein